ncbi:MAG: response regulator transcription factor [Verrucomicrobiota bacterium]
MNSVSDRIQVWIVEDNENFRTTLAEIINQAEDLYCPVNMSSMEQILDKFQDQEDASPEVFILDIGLPGMSGLDGIISLRQRFPESEILVLTVFEDSDKIYEAIKNGATGYLLKTEEMKKIPEAIRESVAGGSPMSKAVARLVFEHFRKSARKKNDYQLSPREKDVLKLMTEGLVKKEMADRLSLSYHTIDSHVRAIYRKLHVNTIQAAVGKALNERLTDD